MNFTKEKTYITIKMLYNLFPILFLDNSINFIYLGNELNKHVE